MSWFYIADFGVFNPEHPERGFFRIKWFRIPFIGIAICKYNPGAKEERLP
jgi:hypothetical protein